MQVVLLSQIAREKGLFDITDVIKGISEKMIRRHPHVFGAPGTEVPDWEAIKQQEKQQRSRELEQAEKAAFRAAAGQIICHLPNVKGEWELTGFYEEILDKRDIPLYK